MSGKSGDLASSRAARLTYVAAWLVVAAVYAALFAASGAATSLALRGAAALILPNALFGRLSLSLAFRWPWPEERSGRGLLRAVVVTVAVSAAVTAGWIVLASLDARIRLGSFQFPASAVVLWQSLLNTMMQLALVGVGHAWYNGERVRLAQARAQRAETLHARAELQLLRTQLNPHFVLNTLHALLGLVRRDPSAAEAAIERLGELLRFGMSVEQRRTDRVAFRDEWAFVGSYLELERLRLGDRLRLSLVADPTTMDVPVPPFAIQPLVENAIGHAVAPRGSGGRLEVSARREHGRLRVEVRDDGPGSTEALILASPRAGLRLLRERLATLYAGEASLTFEAPVDGGFRVLLDLPDAGFPDAP